MPWHEILLIVCGGILAFFGVMWVIVLILERFDCGFDWEPKPVSPYKKRKSP